MKKLTLFAACSCLLLYSCINNKQADITPQGDISATVDGVTQSFKLNTRSSNTNGSAVFIVGNSTTSKDSIILYAWKADDTFDKGTYFSDSLGHPHQRGSEIMVVDNRDSIQYKNTGKYYTIGSVPYNGNIVVTTLTDSLLTGTFSGTIVLGSSLSRSTPVSKTVTNGTFNIQLRKVAHQ